MTQIMRLFNIKYLTISLILFFGISTSVFAYTPDSLRIDGYLRQIKTTQMTYQQLYGKGKFANFRELKERKLLQDNWKLSDDNTFCDDWYLYRIYLSADQKRYCIYAWPLKYKWAGYNTLFTDDNYDNFYARITINPAYDGIDKAPQIGDAYLDKPFGVQFRWQTTEEFLGRDARGIPSPLNPIALLIAFALLVGSIWLWFKSEKARKYQLIIIPLLPLAITIIYIIGDIFSLIDLNIYWRITGLERLTECLFKAWSEGPYAGVRIYLLGFYYIDVFIVLVITMLEAIKMSFFPYAIVLTTVAIRKSKIVVKVLLSLLLIGYLALFIPLFIRIQELVEYYIFR